MITGKWLKKRKFDNESRFRVHLGSFPGREMIEGRRFSHCENQRRVQRRNPSLALELFAIPSVW